jgi:hypothetical protein
MPGDPAATDPKLSAVDRTTKPRRRVGFRKGADLDEELWPAETFGGVSDEQFWDDLASDKPLATTARTAQQEPPSKDRLSGPAPGSGLATGPAPGLDTGPATDPQAAERTAIQPAYAATQPVQGMKPPPGATQPVRVAASSSQPMSAAGRPGAGSQPREVATPPYGTAAQPREAVTPPRGTATPPRGTAAQPREAITPPRGTATPPAGTRRRRPSSAEEDPLTSAAFSLRPKGPVDGRSSLRARNGSADRYDSGASTGSHAGTSAYPSYSAPSYGDPSSQTQTMSTPPYGQNYGYGNSGPAAPPSEPRRRNGSGSHARPEDAAGVTRPVRQAYPRGSHQATGSHRSNGSYPGNGSPLGNSSSQGPGGYPGSGYPANGYPGSGYQGSGYQGNGHRGNGHRAPYDPRDDYRRLTHQY